MNNIITSHEQELLTIIAKLQAQNAKQQTEIAELQKRLIELESKLAKLGKNSSTSSKPPSGDIVKPPKTPNTKSQEKRKQGGQKGHPKHERPPFEAEKIDSITNYILDTCPDCGGSLSPADKAPKVIQQVEIIKKPVRIDEHRGLAYWCKNCQKVHYGKLPVEVEKGGLFAARLTAQVAYMKCACHASFSTIRKYIRDILGEHFSGVLGCDYFSAYRKYMKDCDIRVQFCLAHLIRDIKYLTTLPDKATVAYGETLLNAVREMFRIIHKSEIMNEETFRLLLNNARRDVLLKGMCNVPGTTKEAQNLAKRFRLHGDAYFRFITTPGVEPTNNPAEQAIRFVVIDRVITQGTRSKKGRTWCERIWSVLATCSNQAYSAFEFIYNAVKAYFNPKEPIPSLLPTPP